MSAPSLLTAAILLVLVLHAAWRGWRHPRSRTDPQLWRRLGSTPGVVSGRLRSSVNRERPAAPLRPPTWHGGRHFGPRVATIVVTLLLILLNPTLAAPPFPGDPTILPDPGVADAGTSIDVTGTGFEAHQQGVLTLDGDPSGMPTYRVRGNGTFDEKLAIPAGVAP